MNNEHFLFLDSVPYLQPIKVCFLRFKKIMHILTIFVEHGINKQ